MNFVRNPRVPSLVILPLRVEQFVGAADIGFGLRHRRHVEKDQDWRR